VASLARAPGCGSCSGGVGTPVVRDRQTPLPVIGLRVQRFQHFFKDQDVADFVPDSRADLDTDAVSLMGNLVAPIRIPKP
jgi:hypothetical protein